MDAAIWAATNGNGKCIKTNSSQHQSNQNNTNNNNQVACAQIRRRFHRTELSHIQSMSAYSATTTSRTHSLSKINKMQQQHKMHSNINNNNATNVKIKRQLSSPIQQLHGRTLSNYTIIVMLSARASQFAINSILRNLVGRADKQPPNNIVF